MATHDEPTFTVHSGHLYKCPECDDLLMSTHRHDWVSCKCPNKAFVDGGSAYARLGYMNRPPVRVRTNPLIKDEG